MESNIDNNEDESPSHLLENTPDNMPLKVTVLIRAMTWNRESYGLFDYECKKLNKDDLQIESEGVVIRNNTKVIFKKDMREVVLDDPQDTVLFKLIQNDHSYQIKPINTNQPSDRLWLVIRNFKEKGYRIKKHDIIKLGRMKFRVKEFRTEHEYFNELDEVSPHEGFDEIKTIVDQKEFIEDQEEPNPACRF